MSRVGQVLAFARATEDGAKISLVKVDAGGGETLTAEHYSDSGDDSCPLKGEYAALNDMVGDGEESVVGYLDPSIAPVAGPGEKRIYSRSALGVLAAQVWLKSDGSVVVSNSSGAIELAANGDVTINGVVIDASGNISAKNVSAEDVSAKSVAAEGEVTANALVPATAVKLSVHVHPTAATGPASPPTPGFPP